MDGETVLAKTPPNAFAGTELEARLEAADRKHLIVGGFMTHMCVSSTVRSAADRGLGCRVVAGACARRGSSPTARAALADRFAVVVPDAAGLG